MVGFTLLSRSYYYLRRRSPGPPFPPDHRQAGERGAIKEAKNALVSQRKRSQQYNGDKINSEHQTSGQILNLAKHRKELELKLKKIETR